MVRPNNGAPPLKGKGTQQVLPTLYPLSNLKQTIQPFMLMDFF